MPKTIIEFSSEEEHDLDFCLNGHKYYAIVHEMYNYLRSKTKYAADETPDEVVEALYEAKDFLHSKLSEYNVEIWKAQFKHS